MRFRYAIVAIVLGLAMSVMSVPALSPYEGAGTCAVSISTIYVTIAASAQELVPTVTTASSASSSVLLSLQHAADIPASTVTSTSSLTRTSSISATETFTSNAAGIAKASDSDYITSPSDSGTGPVSMSDFTGGMQSAASSGFYYYTEHNGTTYWLDDHTPDPTRTYVTITSAITVVPYDASPLPTDSIVTVTTAVYSTVHLTSIRTATISPSDLDSGTVTSYDPPVSNAATTQNSISRSVLSPDQLASFAVTSVSTSTNTAHVYTGMGISGWNISLTSGFLVSPTDAGRVHASGNVNGAISDGAATNVSLKENAAAYSILLRSSYSIQPFPTLSAQSGFGVFPSTRSAVILSEKSTSFDPLVTGLPQGYASVPKVSSTTSAGSFVSLSDNTSAIISPTLDSNSSAATNIDPSLSTASSSIRVEPFHYNESDPSTISLASSLNFRPVNTDNTSATAPLTSMNRSGAFSSSTSSCFDSSTSPVFTSMLSSFTKSGSLVVYNHTTTVLESNAAVASASAGVSVVKIGLLDPNATLTAAINVTVSASSSGFDSHATFFDGGHSSSPSNAYGYMRVPTNATVGLATISSTRSTLSAIITSLLDPNRSISDLNSTAQALTVVTNVNSTSHGRGPSLSTILIAYGSTHVSYVNTTESTGVASSNSSSTSGAPLAPSFSTLSIVADSSSTVLSADPAISAGLMVSSKSISITTPSSSPFSLFSSSNYSVTVFGNSLVTAASTTSFTSSVVATSTSADFDPISVSISLVSTSVSISSQSSEHPVNSSYSSTFSTIYGSSSTALNSSSSSSNTAADPGSSSAAGASPSASAGIAASSATLTTLGPVYYPHYSYSSPAVLNAESAHLTLKSSTHTSSATEGVPTMCGETGDFTLNFDDVPPLAISNASAIDISPKPVFNPYHQFLFSDGFTIVPPPTDPYVPSSKPLLIEFVPDFNVNGDKPQAGPNTAELGNSGAISNGDQGLTGCFKFNFYGANFGCDSKGPSCDFDFVGYHYDNVTQVTSEISSHTVSISACPSLRDCNLTPISVDSSFTGLTQLNINVTVAGQPSIWWMDDLHLGWTDNSCQAGLCRLSTHIH